VTPAGLAIAILGPTPSVVGAAFAGVAVYDGACVGEDKDPLRKVEAFRDATQDLSLWEHTKGFAPRCHSNWHLERRVVRLGNEWSVGATSGPQGE
jgi:hypothetical protein